MTRTSIVMAIAGLLFAVPAPAQTGASGTAGDCALARDPLRCMALQKARVHCKDKRGSARQKCIQEKLPAPDCNRDPAPSRCEARQLIQAACRGKTGKARQSCERDLRLATGAKAPAKEARTR